jgi:hypothetical protein
MSAYKSFSAAPVRTCLVGGWAARFFGLSIFFGLFRNGFVLSSRFDTGPKNRIKPNPTGKKSFFGF